MADAISTDLIVSLADPARAAHVLDAVAAQTGDERYRRAAGALRGRHGGRPAIDDTDLLRQMRDLLDTGAAASVNDAAEVVSRTLAIRAGRQSIAHRLSRKYRGIQN